MPNNMQTSGAPQKSIIRKFLDNIVVIVFVVMCVAAFLISGATPEFLLTELASRFTRNTFIVLSLIIPVVAGLGLNFGIVIGAVAAQIAVFFTVYWGFTGLTGLLVCVLVATPLATFFGFAVGALFNKMKGTEMIGGLILGYFSDGVYQFFFLFVLGGIIPIVSDRLIINGGVGVKNAIDLTDNIKYSLDNIPMISILHFLCYVALAVSLITIVYNAIKKRQGKLRTPLVVAGAAVVAYAIGFIPPINAFLQPNRLKLFYALVAVLAGLIVYAVVWAVLVFVKKREKVLLVRSVLLIALAVGVYMMTYYKPLEVALFKIQLPVMTLVVIGMLCVFNTALMKTRLGQNMRTVGQDRTVANSAGINVNRTRIIAMIFSTVLGSWGQLISLQNLGVFNTYGAHMQVGLYAIAALLVGGASVDKATVKQALIGVVLFHTLFVLAPGAGKVLLGDTQIGEYFRVFVAYGVIAISLAMHAWRKSGRSKMR